MIRFLNILKVKLNSLFSIENKHKVIICFRVDGCMSYIPFSMEWIKENAPLYDCKILIDHRETHKDLRNEIIPNETAYEIQYLYDNVYAFYI